MSKSRKIAANNRVTNLSGSRILFFFFFSFLFASEIKNILLKFCSQLHRSPGNKNIRFLVVLPSFSKVTTAPRCISSSWFFTFTCFVLRTGAVSHWFKRIRFEFGHCHGLMDNIRPFYSCLLSDPAYEWQRGCQ